MRHVILVGGFCSTMLVLAQPAPAFSHWHYRHVVYLAPAPLAPVPAAPAVHLLSGTNALNLTTDLLGVLLGNRPQRTPAPDNRPQPPAPVPADVRDTINRVDAALPNVVSKINALSDLNPKYKDKITVTATKDSGTSGGPTPSGGPGTSTGPNG
jgi:hypothetical protein